MFPAERRTPNETIRRIQPSPRPLRLIDCAEELEDPVKVKTLVISWGTSRRLTFSFGYGFTGSSVFFFFFRCADLHFFDFKEVFPMFFVVAKNTKCLVESDVELGVLVHAELARGHEPFAISFVAQFPKAGGSASLDEITASQAEMTHLHPWKRTLGLQTRRILKIAVRASPQRGVTTLQEASAHATAGENTGIIGRLVVPFLP